MPAGFLTPRRLALAGLCLLSLVISSGLAWWQWTRFESPGGTFQNLGYVLQWPLFGLFPAFMIYRIGKLRRAAVSGDGGEPESREELLGREAAEVPAPRRQATRIVHDEDDEELAAYNRYLAELHARDQENR